MSLTYQSVLDNIFGALPMYHKIGSSAYKEGLENIEALTEIVGHPERKIKTIHVAGTNGKGSVTHLLSSYFQEAGYKTGLYTSPHLVDFRERIKINGEMIPEESVVAFFEKYQSEFCRLEPSFFEMTTTLAFHYFAKQQVDIAIIEVGLGGRLDATNVIIPELSVITNISLEHTQLLGDTLAKIAFEKAGIIKNNVPVIIGQHSAETMPVFVKQAELKHAPLYTTDNIKIIEENRTDSLASRSITILSGNNIIGEHILLPLAGDYQFENVATFVQAVLQLSFNIPNVNQLIVKALENVIDNTHLMGRWQIINNKPLTICDTGHNSGGFHFIAQQLNRIDCDHLHIIIGFVNDKDIQAIINLLPKKATYHICKAKIDRALSQNIIQTTMQAGGLTATVSTLSVYETYLQLINDAKDDSVFYIGGSTFIVADFLKEYFNSGASK